MKNYRPDVASLALVLTAACVSGSGNWFSFGPRPPELAGQWIDVALTSPSDTVAWILAPNGTDRTRHISVSRDARGAPSVTVTETSNGLWYLSGRIEDTTNRAICYKRRARDGATCVRFRMDTVATPRFFRRLRVLDYRGERLKEERVFIDIRPLLP